MSEDKKVKTEFKGPGQWRSQASKLEQEREAERRITPKK